MSKTLFSFCHRVTFGFVLPKKTLGVLSKQDIMESSFAGKCLEYVGDDYGFKGIYYALDFF